MDSGGIPALLVGKENDYIWLFGHSHMINRVSINFKGSQGG
jgi:hypothetical protein